MPDREELFSYLESNKITKIKVGGFDIDGVLRGKYISIDKLRSALSGGFGFCDVIFGWDVTDTLYENPSVTGWHTGYPDTLAILDPTTLRSIPWEPGVAALLADFRGNDGSIHPACPRSLLRKVLKRAQNMGFSSKFACEYEFWLFRETPNSLHEKDFRSLQALSPGMFGYSWLREGQHSELMRSIWDGMSAFDIELEGLHTETGPGVYEAAIRYDDALRAADKGALFKTALKQIAHNHGLTATFMAKWNETLPGSSGHLHQSLWRGETNAFVDPSERSGMSATMRYYIGGQIELMPELTALYSPTINSYKRYVPGVWAPLTAAWGVENRTCAIRIIAPGDEKSARVEYRQTAADINPYIAMAACLGAGLYGIENEIEPPAPTVGEASVDASPSHRALPRTLSDAIRLLEESQRARSILGEAFVNHYIRTRQWEIKQYDRAVTDWELRRYFECV